MRQAIVTKYLGPTSTKGARVKATADAGSVTLDYYSVYGAATAELKAHNLMPSEWPHYVAARMLAEKLGWLDGERLVGGTLGGPGYVFVLVPIAD